jgi:hypothetical protein
LVGVEHWAEVRRMHRVERLSIREISRRTGLHRKTVRRALAAEAPPRYVRAPVGSKLDPFKEWICEVGYIPFDPEAANLMFSLVSSRYERASMIVTSNKPFSAWGEIFGDDMAATAMIDRLIHHSEILSLKGDSYRLRGKDLDARSGAKPAEIA